MSDVPYRPRVKLGSLRQTTKKMMVTKASGSKVSDPKLKQFLKEDKGLRRAAYGDQASTTESWRARHYLKDVKGKVKESGQYRETQYSKKTTTAQEFRDTVREEIRQAETAHPTEQSKAEQQRQQRLERAQQNLRRYEQAKQIEREQGRPLQAARDRETGGPATSVTEQTVKPTQVTGGSARAAPIAGSGQALGRPTKTGNPAVAPVGIGSSTTTPLKTGQLPAIFGIRGRALRIDVQAGELLLRILNAPPELALLIGRDRSVKIGLDTRCVRNRASSSASELTVGDLIDARGKVLNEQFIADEVYANNDELPDFVIHLSNSDASKDLPAEPPSELAI
ncbi:MAG: hypothetical protein HY421_02225 [Candidatus Kerfeldbacteria bacterium]|nr:hypothetical protein [Candidatus Kerfeldbacteria bacterium]